MANYGGGSTAAFPVHADGSLGEASAFFQHTGSSVNQQRQRGPHAHSTNLSPEGRYVFVTDLGLDKVLSYRVDAAKGLVPNDPPFTTVAPGSGPRHMAFHPKGKFAYVVNEMLLTVTAFAYDGKRGALKEIQTVPALASDPTPDFSAAEIAVHPSGNFVYSSNRGPNTISVFRVDPGKGTLTVVDRVSTQGKTPRNFGIDPSGTYLFAANQDTDNIVVFRIDQKTGNLTPAGDTLQVGAPVCVVFVAAQ